MVVITIVCYSVSLAADDEIAGTENICFDGKYGKTSLSTSSRESFGCIVGKEMSGAQATYLKTKESVGKLGDIKDVLDKIVTHIASVSASSAETSSRVKQTYDLFNTTLISTAELRSSITARFDKLPQELITSDTIKQLRKEILEEVDKRIAEKKQP